MSKNAEGWIRHRGGKCPVEVGMIVEVRRRSGNIEQLIYLDIYNTEEKWLHFNDSEDIMAYRLHKPVEQVEACSKPELRSLPENYGEIIGGSVEGPIQWRDRITEIDATTQALTAERAELVQKLASEGFALIGRINELLTDAAQKHEDMSDWRNWKKGDWIECAGKIGGYSPGSIYTVKSINHNRGVVHTVTDDSGSITNGWGCNMFIWKSRPSA